MDIKMQRTGENTDIAAVPSVDGGVFVVDHGEHYGQQVHERIDLSGLTDDQMTAIRRRDGDPSAVARFDREHPSSYTFIGGVVARATVSVQGSSNTVSVEIGEREIREFEPMTSTAPTFW